MRRRPTASTRIHRIKRRAALPALRRPRTGVACHPAAGSGLTRGRQRFVETVDFGALIDEVRINRAEAGVVGKSGEFGLSKARIYQIMQETT